MSPKKDLAQKPEHSHSKKEAPLPIERATTGQQGASAAGVSGKKHPQGELPCDNSLLELMKHSIDRSPASVYWLDAGGNFLYINESGCKALGYTREELLKMHVSAVNPRATPDRWAEVWQSIKDRGTIRIESVHRRKDGS
jgi:PAS domain-containing protein